MINGFHVFAEKDPRAFSDRLVSAGPSMYRTADEKKKARESGRAKSRPRTFLPIRGRKKNGINILIVTGGITSMSEKNISPQPAEPKKGQKNTRRYTRKPK